MTIIRRTVLPVVLALSGACMMPSFAASRPPVGDSAAALAVVERFVQAQAAYDQAALERVLAPGYVEISPLGKVDTRSEAIGFYGKEAAAKAAADGISQAARLVEPVVDVGGGRALVFAREDVVVTAQGAQRSASFRAAFFLRASGAGWRIVAAQYTPIREPSAPAPAAATTPAATAPATTAPAGQPAFLFLGSHHMNNHARDLSNVDAADVTMPAKQAEILAVVDALAAFRPTKIMIERDVADQDDVQAQLTDTCRGTRPPSREEYEQIGFRLACRLRIPVVAVNYNALGPIQDAAKIDLAAANPADWNRVKALGDSDAAQLQALERSQSIGDLLRYLNSDAKTRETASRYYLLAQLSSPTEPVGANWVQYWYGRNLAIFNNIARNASAGDRVLVIYGYGHGYILRRMAEESGMFDVVDTGTFLSEHL